jgi:hypothetical protein
MKTFKPVKFFSRLSALMIIIIFSASFVAQAQKTPLLTDEEFRMLVNEISGDIAYEHIRLLTQWHRASSTPAYHEAALYIKKKAEEIGLTDVKLIKLKFPERGWVCNEGELWVVEPYKEKITSWEEVAVSICNNSRSADLTAELVDVGDGTSDKDYEGKDVAGKVVLASGSGFVVMQQAVWKRGAAGLLLYGGWGRGMDHPDQIAWSFLPYESKDKKPGTFGFSLSYRQGMKLKELLKTSDKPVTVKVKLDTEFVDPGWQEMVEGIIPGSKIHDQDIVFTSHIQEEKFSANDNATGLANGLEIARAFIRMIKDGRMKQPLRDIRIWWCDEISSERQYFADNPEERSQFLADVNQDMSGANLTLGGRTQNICLTPYSRPSYLSDVTQNIIEFMIKGNHAQLAALQAGSEVPFPKPVLSLLGTRDPYRAAIIPFHINTDHMVFNASIIGVPGISFTNWPDDYIHSSDDDLWNVDRTQLQRNAVAAAAIMYYLANLDESGAPTLAAEVYSNAISRCARELKLAMNMIQKGDSAAVFEGYKKACNQLYWAFNREDKAIDSISVFIAKDSPVSGLLQNYKMSLKNLQKEYQANLDRHFLIVTGEKKVPALTRTAKEKELSQKVPKLITSVEDYYTLRRKIKPVAGLHPIMAYEILNFVDGKNCYLANFSAVSAEALSAGEYYYGKVTLEMVEQFLNNALEAGIITLENK